MVVREGSAPAPSIPPGGQGKLALDPAKPADRAEALTLRVADPSGRELWTWVWPLPKAGDQTTRINQPAPQRTTSTETAEAIEVKAGDLSVKFNKQTGLLTEVSRSDRKFSLSNGPRLGSGNATLTNLRSEQDGPDWIVAGKFSGDLKSVLWRVFGNGWVKCDYTCTASGTNDSFGVVFDYPENLVQAKRWLGNGPYRVWKNRQGGVMFGVWSNVYNNTITGHRDWIYPEFKGCFTDIRWLQLITAEGLITVVPEHIPFVQVLTPEQPPDRLVGKTKFNLPAAGLGFLNGIPAVGTKFKDATFSGPQSQPNVASGEYSGTVSFYFGPLPTEP
jgi:hypothetical protein